MQLHQRIFVVIFLCVSLISCAKKPPAQPVAGPKNGALQELRHQLETIFADAALQNAFWGVDIESLDTGESIYEVNSHKLFLPASNMKVVTAVAALSTLSPTFTFQTQFQTDDQGDLIVIGSGDPTVNAEMMQQWVQNLKEQGIIQVNGDLIGDDTYFDDQRRGAGWSWDDLEWYYAAEVSALQFNENAFTVTIHAGPAGQPTTVELVPQTDYVTILNTTTSATGVETKVDWKFDQQTNTVSASGVIAENGQDYGTFAITNPTLFFLHALRQTLEQNGIHVIGDSYRARDRNFVISADAKTVLTYSSQPLSQIVSHMLKVSDNLYAETLLKTMGKIVKEEGSAEAGEEVVEELLTKFGVPPQTNVLVDGSGLSRYSYLTPETLMHIFRKMYRDPNSELFYNSLAIAGVDGTLKNRMKGTKAEGNVHAKTGSVSNVRSLSGYVRTADGEMIAFVFFCNNFTAPSQTVDYDMDLAVETLANFQRGETGK